jgi:hypothetical protein
MRMVSLRKQHEYLILALNRHLKVIMLKASQRELDDGSLNILSSNTLDGLRSVRRRKSSLTSDIGNSKRRSSMIRHQNGQATVEAVGNETTIAIVPASITPTTRRISFSLPPSTPPITGTTMIDNIYTVPIQEHEYVNALAVCPATQSKLFVG